eukprot:TRINITY_DN1788_c0_g1_i2.p1 TRINITY_DN1788_c0_g1~~TRINITY_DN1788_c0_g1_i2.p1  ORF type:complete len:2920 (+),score=686.20 TRINITY_DN1788_c0_g1_i2:556-8760(+)
MSDPTLTVVPGSVTCNLGCSLGNVANEDAPVEASLDSLSLVDPAETWTISYTVEVNSAISPDRVFTAQDQKLIFAQEDNGVPVTIINAASAFPLVTGKGEVSSWDMVGPTSFLSQQDFADYRFSIGEVFTLPLVATPMIGTSDIEFVVDTTNFADAAFAGIRSFTYISHTASIDSPASAGEVSAYSDFVGADNFATLATFDLSGVINSATGQTVTFHPEFIIANYPENKRGEAFPLRLSFHDGRDTPLELTSIQTSIAEPLLQIEYLCEAANGSPYASGIVQAGDLVSCSITLTNGASGDTDGFRVPAYDVVISDLLPDVQWEVRSGSVASSSPTPAVISDGNNGSGLLGLSLPVLLHQASWEVSWQLTLTESVYPSELIRTPESITVEWHSSPLLFDNAEPNLHARKYTPVISTTPIEATVDLVVFSASLSNSTDASTFVTDPTHTAAVGEVQVVDGAIELIQGTNPLVVTVEEISRELELGDAVDVQIRNFVVTDLPDSLLPHTPAVAVYSAGISGYDSSFVVDFGELVNIGFRTAEYGQVLTFSFEIVFPSSEFNNALIEPAHNGDTFNNDWTISMDQSNESQTDPEVPLVTLLEFSGSLVFAEVQSQISCTSTWSGPAHAGATYNCVVETTNTPDSDAGAFELIVSDLFAEDEFVLDSVSVEMANPPTFEIVSETGVLTMRVVELERVSDFDFRFFGFLTAELTPLQEFELPRDTATLEYISADPNYSTAPPSYSVPIVHVSPTTYTAGAPTMDFEVSATSIAATDSTSEFVDVSVGETVTMTVTLHPFDGTSPIGVTVSQLPGDAILSLDGFVELVDPVLFNADDDTPTADLVGVAAVGSDLANGDGLIDSIYFDLGTVRNDGYLSGSPADDEVIVLTVSVYIENSLQNVQDTAFTIAASFDYGGPEPIELEIEGTIDVQSIVYEYSCAPPNGEWTLEGGEFVDCQLDVFHSVFSETAAFSVNAIDAGTEQYSIVAGSVQSPSHPDAVIDDGALLDVVLDTLPFSRDSPEHFIVAFQVEIASSLVADTAFSINNVSTYYCSTPQCVDGARVDKASKQTIGLVGGNARTPQLNFTVASGDLPGSLAGNDPFTLVTTVGETVTFSMEITPIYGITPLSVTVSAPSESASVVFNGALASSADSLTFTESISTDATSFTVGFPGDIENLHTLSNLDHSEKVFVNVTMLVLNDTLSLSDTFSVKAHFDYGVSVKDVVIPVSVVLPSLNYSAVLTPASRLVDGGDVITIEITISNDEEHAVGAGVGVGAYDILLVDSFSEFHTFVTDSATASLGGVVVAEDNDFEFLVDYLPWGETLTISYSAQVTSLVQPGTFFERLAASVTSRSSPLVGAEYFEEVVVLSEATFEVVDVEASFSIDADVTSDLSPLCTDSLCEVTFGRPISFLFTFSLIDGTTEGLLEITSLVNSSAPLVIESFGVREVSASGVIGIFEEDEGTVADDGLSASLPVGPIVNAESLTEDDFVSVEVIAYLSDFPETVSGAEFMLDGLLTYSDDFEIHASTVAGLVVEPLLTTGLSVDSGSLSEDENGPYQPSSITIAVAHSPESSVTAYEVNVTVPFPHSRFRLVEGSVAVVGTTESTITVSPSGDLLTVTLPSLPVGGEVDITYSALLHYENIFATGEGEVTQQATTEWHSTQSIDPSRYRQYSTISDEEFVGLNSPPGAPIIYQSIVTSSYEGTSDPELVVGEVVSFSLFVGVPHDVDSEDFNVTVLVEGNPEAFRFADGAKVVSRGSSLVGSNDSPTFASAASEKLNPDELDSSFVVHFGPVTNINESDFDSESDYVGLSWSLRVRTPVPVDASFSVTYLVTIGDRVNTETVNFVLVQPLLILSQLSTPDITLLPGSVTEQTFELRHGPLSTLLATNLELLIKLDAPDTLATFTAISGGGNSTSSMPLEQLSADTYRATQASYGVDDVQVFVLRVTVPDDSDAAPSTSVPIAFTLTYVDSELPVNQTQSKYTSIVDNAGRILDPFNPCDNDDDLCRQVCESAPPYDYFCSCYSGYTLDTDTGDCLDIDECLFTSPKPCPLPNQICTNTVASFTCTCPEDMDTLPDGSCVTAAPSTCNNSELDEGEECDGKSLGCVQCQCADGYRPQTPLSLYCEEIPADAVCGDFLVNQSSEECDGGIGCDESCLCKANYTAHDPASADCALTTVPIGGCGDGRVTGAEECEPPYLGGCLETCFCDTGSGYVATGTGKCKFANPCGNGLLDSGEQCESGPGCKDCLCNHSEGWVPYTVPRQQCKYVDPADQEADPCDGLPQDQCGQCLPFDDPQFDSCLGCDGVPFSTKIIDECGVCRFPPPGTEGALATDPNFGVCEDDSCDSGYLTDLCYSCLIPGVQADEWDICIGCDGVPFSGFYTNWCGLCVDPENPVSCAGVACNGKYDSSYEIDACGECRDKNLSEFVTDELDCIPNAPLPPQVKPKIHCWDNLPFAEGQTPKFVAFFSYDNIGGEPSTILHGEANYFELIENRNQPQFFPAGAGPIYGASGVFPVVWNGTKETWYLGSRKVSIDLLNNMDNLMEYRCPEDFDADFLLEGPAASDSESDSDSNGEEVAVSKEAVSDSTKRFELDVHEKASGSFKLSLSQTTLILRSLLARVATIRRARLQIALQEKTAVAGSNRTSYKVTMAILPAQTKPTTTKRQTVLEEVVELSSSKAAYIMLDGPQLEKVLSAVGLEEDRDSGATYEPLSETIASVNSATGPSPPSFLLLLLVATMACWFL